MTVVFAILAIPLHSNPEGARYGKIDEYLRELTVAGRRHGIITYVFSPKGFMPQKHGCYGDVFDEKSNMWRRFFFPLPHVVYDRVSSRRLEESASIKQLKKQLHELGIKFFNPEFLDKWETHWYLQKFPEVRGYLPDTRRIIGFRQVLMMLEKYGDVYLKPRSGSLGRGIINLRKTGSGEVLVRITRNGPDHVGLISSPEKLRNLLERRVGQRPYIIQQGIPLAQVEGRPFDIRILMQKDLEGDWRQSSSVVRVAREGRIVANLAGGGEMFRVRGILERVFLKKVEEEGMIEQLRIAGRTIAEALEKAMGQTFGELGLDMGVDMDRKIWLIEVNSRPARDNTQAVNFNAPRASVLRLLGFVKYLVKEQSRRE